MKEEDEDYYKKFKLSITDDQYYNFPDDDQDEDYNFIDDILINNKDYIKDHIPYNALIARKEIEDINKCNTFEIKEDEKKKYYTRNLERGFNKSISLSSRKSRKNFTVSNFNFVLNSNKEKIGIESSAGMVFDKSDKDIARGNKTNEKWNPDKNNDRNNKNQENTTEKKPINCHSYSNINSKTNHNSKERIESNNQEYNSNNSIHQSPSSNSPLKSLYNINTFNKPAFTQTLININTNQSNTFQYEINDLLRIILKQYDYFLQLNLQNGLLAEDKETKDKSIQILEKFFNEKELILNSLGIEKEDVYIESLDIFNKGQPLKIAPQCTFFQSPVLEICPLLSMCFKESFDVDQCRKLLSEFGSFINPYYLPLVSSKRGGVNYDENDSNEDEEKEKSKDKDKNKEINENVNNFFRDCRDNQKNQNNNFNHSAKFKGVNHNSQEDNHSDLRLEESIPPKKNIKFDKIQDGLLTIGLHYFGKKNLELVQMFFLREKSLLEIKHRVKNLTCHRAAYNIVKRIKNMSGVLMNKQEFNLFIDALNWFGPKFSLISRFILQERPPLYLEEVYNTLVYLEFIKEETTISKRRRKADKQLTEWESDIKKLALDFKEQLEEIGKQNNPELIRLPCFPKDIDYYKLEHKEPGRIIKRYAKRDVEIINEQLELYETIELDK